MTTSHVGSVVSAERVIETPREEDGVENAFLMVPPTKSANGARVHVPVTDQFSNKAGAKDAACAAASRSTSPSSSTDTSAKRIRKMR